MLERSQSYQYQTESNRITAFLFIKQAAIFQTTLRTMLNFKCLAPAQACSENCVENHVRESSSPLGAGACQNEWRCAMAAAHSWLSAVPCPRLCSSSDCSHFGVVLMYLCLLIMPPVHYLDFSSDSG